MKYSKKEAEKFKIIGDVKCVVTDKYICHKLDIVTPANKKIAIDLILTEKATFKEIEDAKTKYFQTIEKQPQKSKVTIIKNDKDKMDGKGQDGNK